MDDIAIYKKETLPFEAASLFYLYAYAQYV